MSDLLLHLNQLLSPDMQIANLPALKDIHPLIRMFSVGTKDGVGARDLEWERSFIKNFPNLEFKPLDFNDNQIKSLLSLNNLSTLPAYFFDSTLDQIPDLVQAMKKRRLLEKRGEYYMLIQDGISKFRWSSPIIKNELALFVMSQCPYGVKAETAVISALRNESAAKDLKLKLHFIVGRETDAQGNPSFSSLHGDQELQENIRQMIIQKYYPEKLIPYLEVRNTDYKADNWEAVATQVGIDPASISQHLSEGPQLLESEYELTQTLGIQASPSYMFENSIVIGKKTELSHYLGFELK